MTRTTRAELDSLAGVINRLLYAGPETPAANVHEVGWAYGRPRLTRDGGSREVSPRLPSGELAEWMHAYIAGIEAGRR